MDEADDDEQREMDREQDYITVLPTIRCRLIQGDIVLLIRILLDSGSGLGLVRRDRARQARLRGRPCTLTLGGVGGYKTTSTEREFSVQIGALEGDYVTPHFVVITKEKVTDTMPPLALDSNDAFLETMHFSEDIYSPHDREIDLIVPSHIYYELDVHETAANHRTDPRKLRVLHCKLGNTLGGQRPLLEVDIIRRQKRNETLDPQAHVAEVYAALETAEVSKFHEEDPDTGLTRWEVEKLTKFLKLEGLGIEEEDSRDSEEDKLALAMMYDVTFFDEEQKRYVTDFLWRPGAKEKIRPNEAASLTMARRQHDRNIAKGMQDQVDAAYQQLIDVGYAERVPDDEMRPTDHPYTYIGSFVVYKWHSESTKLRIVLNSAQRDYLGNEFNHYFYSGPCFLGNIIDHIFRFRCNKNVAVADIYKFFYMTAMNRKTGAHDLIRFWYKFKGDDKFYAYRAVRLTFGHVSAPSQAHFSIKLLTDDNKEEFPRAWLCVAERMYVDDIVEAEDDEDLVVESLVQLNNLLPQGSFRLTKIATNNHAIITKAQIPPEMLSQKKIHSLLGIQWDKERDVLIFDVAQVIKDHAHEWSAQMNTFRYVASLAATLFDPCGWISPIIYPIKLLQKMCWQRKLKWHSAIDADIIEILDAWKDSALNCKPIEIERYLPIKKTPFDMLVLGDASEDGCCATIFYRFDFGDRIEIKLAFSKTRVSPLKGQTLDNYPCTVARLELLAAALALRMSIFLKKTVEVQPRHTYYFTDSTVTYYRLSKDPSSYKAWVANRLRYIKDNSNVEDWYHIPGALNSSDLGTRNMKPHKLADAKLWWEGPSFLKKSPETWRTVPKALTAKEARAQDELDELEVNRSYQACFIHPECSRAMPLDALIDRFEHWSKIVAIMTYFLRFLLKTCPSLAKRSKLFALFKEQVREKGKPSPHEERACTLMLVRRMQQRLFATDFRDSGDGRYELRGKSKLIKFDPFIDELDLVRARTRLLFAPGLTYSERCPIILPKSEVSQKLVLHIHKSLMHGSPGTTYYQLLQEYVVIGGRRTVYAYVRRCRTRGCAPPLRLHQPDAQLPPDRLQTEEVFSSVGIDVFGPFFAKVRCLHGENCSICLQEAEAVGRGRRTKQRDEQRRVKKHYRIEKRYSLLASDLFTRGIHIEFLYQATTEELIMALIRFFARKGTPRKLYSDNAQTFIKANADLKALYASINWSKVTSEVEKKGVEWVFLTACAPHTHGVYERAIRNVREALTVALRHSPMNDRELETQMIAAEAIVNSRPLMAPTDGDDFQTISPSHLLLGKGLRPVPFDARKLMDAAPKDLSLTRLHRQRKEVLSKFCAIWQKQYLLSHQLNFGNRAPGNLGIAPGDPLLHIDKNLKRGKWRLVKVIDLHGDYDGKIRTITVKSPDHKNPLTRTIRDFAYLEGHEPYRPTDPDP